MSRFSDSLARVPIAAQFARFAIVGCLNVGVSFVFFFLCYKIWPLATILMNILGDAGAWVSEKLVAVGVYAIDAAFANIIGYIAGTINSFILNKLWMFQARGCPIRQLHRFLVLNILGLSLSTLMIFLFVDFLGGPYLVIWLITIGMVMVLNFLGQKYWAFSEELPYETTH